MIGYNWFMEQMIAARENSLSVWVLFVIGAVAAFAIYAVGYVYKQMYSLDSWMEGFKCFLQQIKERFERNAPENTSRLLNPTALDDLASCFDFFMQPICYDCGHGKGLYVLFVEYARVHPACNSSTQDIIRSCSLAVRRFYKKAGMSLNQNEICVIPQGNSVNIYIALNPYGQKQIMLWNKEQQKTFR